MNINNNDILNKLPDNHNNVPDDSTLASDNYMINNNNVPDDSTLPFDNYNRRYDYT
nr:6328_t:CDS:2 [Entrophospora candida]